MVLGQENTVNLSKHVHWCRALSIITMHVSNWEVLPMIWASEQLSRSVKCAVRNETPKPLHF
jgi:hypothetical protein